jgi:hypothetical protein
VTDFSGAHKAISLINAKHQDITFFSFAITIAHHFCSHLVPAALGGTTVVVATTTVVVVATTEAAGATSGAGVGEVNADATTVKARDVLDMIRG